MGLFAISASITPGPNTLMLLASGVNFGFRRTLPHVLGITVGFPAMIMAIGLGLGGLFEAYPRIHVILKYVGMAYLLWLAWKVATAESAEDAACESKPFGLFQAAAFQWVNPKAWIVSVSAIATYTSLQGDFMQEVVLIAVIFGIVSVPAVTSWTFFGTAIRRLLKSERARTLFNWAMAGLLVASLLPILFA